MKSSEQAAYRVYCGLPTRKKLRVMSWRELGNPWSDSLINSGVLADPDQSAYPRTPSEAARQAESDRLDEILLTRRVRNLLPDEVSRRYETAHHESAHAIVVLALGKALRSVSIDSDDARGGLCTFAKGSTPLEIATICVAPIVWLERVYYRQFPYYLPNGATGCDSDLRKAREAAGDWELNKAFKLCRDILKENFDSVEAVARTLDREGEWRPGHTRPRLPG